MCVAAQGLVSLNDVRDVDATLCVLSGSHLLWREFFEAFPPAAKASGADWHKLTTPQHVAFFTSRGCAAVAVPMAAGSLALWNSKTFHFGREPLASRPSPATRIVAYVCMTPCPGLRQPGTAAMLARKLGSLAAGRTTTHWPHRVQLFPMAARTYGRAPPRVTAPTPPALEDLTPLARLLAGLRPGGPAWPATPPAAISKRSDKHKLHKHEHEHEHKHEHEHEHKHASASDSSGSDKHKHKHKHKQASNSGDSKAAKAAEGTPGCSVGVATAAVATASAGVDDDDGGLNKAMRTSMARRALVGGKDVMVALQDLKRPVTTVAGSDEGEAYGDAATSCGSVKSKSDKRQRTTEPETAHSGTGCTAA